MGCKIRSLTSTNTMSPLRNNERPWRTNIRRRMLAPRIFFYVNTNSYKMVENRPVIDKFHELQRTHANMKLHKIEMNEVFIVLSIIDKLPPWRDVRHALKHKREEIILSDLGQHI